MTNPLLDRLAGPGGVHRITVDDLDAVLADEDHFATWIAAHPVTVVTADDDRGDLVLLSTDRYAALQAVQARVEDLVRALRAGADATGAVLDAVDAALTDLDRAADEPA